jgi:hypothetical protein
MARQSAWNGNRVNNKRPVIVLAPDAYVAIQGETYLVGCGLCKKQIPFNKYITGITVDATTDSPPGTANINLTVPDNEITDFYAENELVILPMMEIEIFAKGYYLIGGVPQYYKIFWGIVSSVTKSWSNGVTTLQISARDILRWWELTVVTLNPSFLDPLGSSAGGYQLYQNQFAGLNPYAVVMALARDAMGDWSTTVSSLNDNTTPEKGAERNYFNDNMGGIMLYWQAKFGKIWNSLVLYGASGQLYRPSKVNDGTVSLVHLSKAIADKEFEFIRGESEFNQQLKIQPNEIAAYKVEVPRAGETSFFEPNAPNKLSVALQARDQIGYEFYCDTNGDIVFKPPFFNVNVIPNKPISWIQDIDIIDDSIQDSEAEVYTHITSSGNAFGGTTDWGVTDEFTRPSAGVYDFHLLRRYGWRRHEMQLEWAGNSRKLYFHIMDFLDRLNARRKTGSVTIPMRPEIRMGFPVWIPKYDSFFYIQGVSHSYSVGGDATTTLSLMARRSKFLAPKNIGKLRVTGYEDKVETKLNNNGTRTVTTNNSIKVRRYSVEFPDIDGSTNNNADAEPIILRHPKTGKLLGYPRVVMVLKKGIDGQQLANSIAGTTPKTKSLKKGKPGSDYDLLYSNAFALINASEQEEFIASIRRNRYEASASNIGQYDYAEDVSRTIKEFQIVDIDNITYKNGTALTRKKLSPQEIKALQSEAKKLATQKADYQKEIKKASSDISELTKMISDRVKDITDESEGLDEESIKKKLDEDELLTEMKDYFEVSQVLVKSRTKDIRDIDRLIAVNLARQSAFKQKANTIIRPVSDEFGFEVIGHYRYGRGAYIDRGKTKLETENGIANQINVQFAPTGQLLTDSIGVEDPNSVDFARAYEKMADDEWNTGGFLNYNSAISKKTNSDFTMTDVNTFANDVYQNKGKSVFINVDTTRESILLSELKPIDTKIGTAAENNCSCIVGRSDWLSVLPESLIRSVAGGANFTTEQDARDARFLANDLDPDLSSPFSPNDSLNTYFNSIRSSRGPGGFLNILKEFLRTKFDNEIGDNSLREKEYSGEARKKFVEVKEPPIPGVFGSPGVGAGNSLFDRAVRGDKNALELVKNEANFNFGAIGDAYDNLINTANVGAQNIRQSFSTLGDETISGLENSAGVGYINNSGDSRTSEYWNAGGPIPSPPDWSKVVNNDFYAASYIAPYYGI